MTIIIFNSNIDLFHLKSYLIIIHIIQMKFKRSFDRFFLIRIFHLHAFAHIITSLFRPISSKLFYDLEPDNQPQFNYKKFIACTTKNNKINLKQCLLDCFRFDFILAGILTIFVAALGMAGPIFLKKVLYFLQKTSYEIQQEKKAFYYIEIWLALSICKIFLNEYSQRLFFLIGLRIQQILFKAIINKIIKMPSHTRKQIPKAQILNYLMIDVKLAFYAFKYMSVLFSAPTTILLVIISIFQEGKIYGYILIQVLIIVILLQIYIDQQMSRCRIKKLHIQQQRVNTNVELISQYKQIKQLGWEKLLSTKTAYYRKKENDLNQRYFLLAHLYDLVLVLIPLIVVGMIFLIQLRMPRKKQILGASQLYIMISFINLTYYPMKYLRNLIIGINDFNQAIAKIQIFLDNQDNQIPSLENPGLQIGNIIISQVQCCDIPKHQHHQLTLHHQSQVNHISVRNSKDSKTKKPSGSKLDLQMDLELNKGDILFVLSKKGEGELLLSTLAGEANITRGRIQYRGSLSYLSDRIWFSKKSIKENICFGRPVDQTLLRKVYNISGLKDEIQNFVNKQNTILNESSFTDSQKKRIALARVLYSQSDILILNGIFDGIDYHSIEKIYYNLNNYAKDKTIVISTDITHFIQDKDKVLLFHDGKAVQFDTFKKLCANKNSLIKQYINQKHDQLTEEELYEFKQIQLKQKQEKIQKKQHIRKKLRTFIRSLCALVKAIGVQGVFAKIDENIKNTSLQKINQQQLEQQHSDHHHDDGHEHHDHYHIEDDKRVNPISQNSYKRFFLNTYKTKLLLLIFLIFLTQCIKVFLNWWIGHIKHHGHGHGHKKLNIAKDEKNILIYIEVTLLFAIIYAIQGYIGVVVTRFCSDNLSQQMVSHLPKAQDEYFDTHDIIIVTAKISKDFEEVFNLYHLSINILRNLVVFLATVILVSIKTPTFIFFGIGIILANVAILLLFMRTQRQIMRYFSPFSDNLYSSFQKIIDGFQTIKKFGKPSVFISEQEENIYKYSVIKINEKYIYHAMSILCEFSTLLIIAWPIYVAVTQRKQFSQSELVVIGISITYSLKLTGLFSSIIKQIVTIESGMRLNIQKSLDIIDLKTQHNYDSPSKPENWPHNNSIVLENVSLKTDTNQNLSLKYISLNIKSSQKVVLIGRSQSGIHQFLLSIAKFLKPIKNIDHTIGKIKVCGTNLQEIGRKHITEQIIYLSESPLIFSATLRQNIDPFKQYNDRDILKIVKKLKIQKQIEVKCNEKLLDAKIDISKAKLDLKNSINIARALLKKPAILLVKSLEPNLLDISPQFLISQELRQTTIIYICQNMDYALQADKILALVNGRIAQFGQPKILLNNAKGVFSTILKSKEPSLYTHIKAKSKINK